MYVHTHMYMYAYVYECEITRLYESIYQQCYTNVLFPGTLYELRNIIKFKKQNALHMILKTELQSNNRPWPKKGSLYRSTKKCQHGKAEIIM